MAIHDLPRPGRNAEAFGYQGPTPLAYPATASYPSFTPKVEFAAETRLRHGDLMPQDEALFGSPFQVSSWRWTKSRAPLDGEASTLRSGLEPSFVEKRSHPRLDRCRIQLDIVWVGQGNQRAPIADANALAAVWPPSGRGARLVAEPSADPPARFIASEELTGRIDEFDAATGNALCTVWRRRFKHDPYSWELPLAEFPASQRHLVTVGQLFYWTFGDLIVRGLPKYTVTRIAVKRPPPDAVLQRAHEMAVRRAHSRRTNRPTLT